MYFSALHGQATSVSPGSRGAPTECIAGTHARPAVICSSAADPMRVIVPMLTTT